MQCRETQVSPGHCPLDDSRNITPSLAATNTHARAHARTLFPAIRNGATVLLGTATSFPTLLAARIILGIGEAFSAPASYSLIADYFPSEGRGEANAWNSCSHGAGRRLSRTQALKAIHQGAFVD